MEPTNIDKRRQKHVTETTPRRASTRARCIGKMPGIPSAVRQKSRTLVEISEMMRVCMQVCCKRNIIVVGVGYIGRICSPFTDRKRWKSRRSGFKSWSDGQTIFIGKGTNEMYNDIHYMEKGHIARTKVLRTKLACTPALVTMSQLLYIYFFLVCLLLHLQERLCRNKLPSNGLGMVLSQFFTFSRPHLHQKS